MGDFRKDPDGHWWFYVTGKGNKARTVTVSNAMLKALKRYRRSLGLPPLPTLNESIPLIAKGRGRGPLTSTRHLRRLVQHCFDHAYARMRRGDSVGSVSPTVPTVSPRSTSRRAIS